MNLRSAKSKRISGARGKLKVFFGEAALLECWIYGLNAPSLLQISHINHDPSDNSRLNLACLCPNCHRAFDLGLLPKKRLIEGRRRIVNGTARVDADTIRSQIERNDKAGKTNWGILRKAESTSWTKAALKAHETRRKMKNLDSRSAPPVDGGARIQKK